MIASVFLALSTACLNLGAVPPIPPPPPTEARPVTDTVHGVAITDNFRWLEGDERGGMTAEVDAWTLAQNAHTREVLDNLPGRKELEARLRPLMEIGSVSAPKMRGNRYFYSRREGTEAQARVFVREGHDGTPRLLLDPTTIDPSGLVTIAWTAPNHAGDLLAFGMYRAGDENTTLYVMSVNDGRWLPVEIPGKIGGVSWLPDSTGFFYRRLEDLKDPYSGTVKFHRLGTHHRHDPVLFSQGSGAHAEFLRDAGYTAEQIKSLATTYGPFAYTSRDARWMIVGYYTGTRSNDLWVVDLDRWMRTGGPEGRGEFVKRPILSGTLTSGASGYGPILGDTLLLRTTLGAPAGKVVSVDLNNPGENGAGWAALVPERPDAVIEGVSLARGVLLVQYIEKAVTAIEKFAIGPAGAGAPGARSLGRIELPEGGVGSASIAVEEDRSEAFLTYTSFNAPTSIYRTDLATGETKLWERPAVPVDPSTIEVKQVWYSSKDGTKVSMFVVHRKGLSLTGDNPTVLNGYGGFNASQSPFFSATLTTWFDDGGVFALPNLRGGGEYGEKWHRGGILENKQNVFDDFIAAAEWLIQNNYTNPKKLAITGGSNGGLLTGAALTQRPDLFAAAISAVPLLDMIRYQDFLMARYWVPEYGSSEDANQFKFLMKYSPYHNIRPGVKYPAVLLTAGENDARVHPMHARKMVAALRAATASDQRERPILLWVDRESGHGGGKPLHLRIRDAADQRIFLMWQTGLLGRN